MLKITDSIFNVGVNDTKIKLFESQYPVPDGMAYNSYLINDQKTAVLDSVDSAFVEEWLANIQAALNECGAAEPDYIVVHHMEGDHSAGLAAFLKKYPAAKVVTSRAALAMLNAYFEDDWTSRAQIIKEGDVLDLGTHKLNFVAAPLVHWPEVMVSYESAEKILFSADAFGSFGTNDGSPAVYEDWLSEARRYYIGIVGKFGAQVQALLKKAAALDVKKVCSLHGKIIECGHGGGKNFAEEKFVEAYNKWSLYEAESEGVFIPYCSVYGHTQAAVALLADALKEKGTDVCVMNLAVRDLSEAVAAAFKYKNVVFASVTYNGGVFPFMHDLLDRLTEHNFSKRNVAFIENGSWAPAAAKTMRALLEPCKEINFLEPAVSVKCALNETSRKQVKELAAAL